MDRAFSLGLELLRGVAESCTIKMVSGCDERLGSPPAAGAADLAGDQGTRAAVQVRRPLVHFK